MGNVDSRSKHDAGYIYVQTDKPFYSPGEQCTGKIFVRCVRPVDAKYIEIEVKGKEKGSFIEQEVEYHNEPDGTRRAEFKDVKRKADRTVYDFKAPCFNFQSGLVPGDYVIPFQFMLPQGIPSSLLYSNKHHPKKPSAKTKYHIKATVQTHSNHNEMKYKSVLIIREHPPKLENDISKISEHNITTWCCMNQGTSRIEVKFDKNTFEPHDSARCKAVLDNSQCNVAMENIRLAIEQEITINCGHGRIFHDTVTLVDKTEHGVPAREAQKVERVIEVDLDKIKNHAPTQHKKKGVMKAVSMEDQFMMSMAQPACHGHIAKNEYFIACRTSYQGCTCCAGLPTARIPMVIVPIPNPALLAFKAPDDFKPQMHPMANVDVKIGSFDINPKAPHH